MYTIILHYLAEKWQFEKTLHKKFTFYFIL